MVAPPCKCSIVGAYIFTFVTVQYIFIIYILFSVKDIHIKLSLPVCPSFNAIRTTLEK